MNTQSQLPYGHAYCPHCKSVLNLGETKPTFMEKAPFNDYLVYVLCHKCADEFGRGDSNLQKTMGNRCFLNTKQTALNSNGRTPPWAVTTTLALELNKLNLVDTHERGLGLSVEEYMTICTKKYEVHHLPFGFQIITSEEDEENKS